MFTTWSEPKKFRVQDILRSKPKAEEDQKHTADGEVSEDAPVNTNERCGFKHGFLRGARSGVRKPSTLGPNDQWSWRKHFLDVDLKRTLFTDLKFHDH